ncbi:MAG: class I SAM-dependent methyltransferase [Chloroflexales bacterium]|nr:class I SAM-dependent methyltransferase [Chloroflexales bacterium]
MLTLARTKALQQAIANISFVQAGFLSYVHDREPADFVYSRNALHHLSDFWKALALSHIAATLRPGGVFVLRDLVFSCEPHEIAEVVDAWLAHAPDTPDVGWTRRELEEHLRTEHSTFSWLLEPLLERTGFDLSDIHYDASRVFATYICTRRR